MECSHCKKRFSSTIIDAHEYKCEEELSASAKKKLMGIPETKGSTHQHSVIRKVDSDQDFGDVGTPERNQVVLEQPASGLKSRQPSSPLHQNRQKNEMSLLKKHVSQQYPYQKGSVGLNMLNSATHEREKKMI